MLEKGPAQVSVIVHRVFASTVLLSMGFLTLRTSLLHTKRMAERISCLNYKQISNKLRSAVQILSSFHSIQFGKHEDILKQHGKAPRLLLAFFFVTCGGKGSIFSPFAYFIRKRKGSIFSLALLTLSNLCSES